MHFVVVAVQALAYAAMPDYDVVVYGSTPAGIAAAVSAGYLGHKVALYEPLVMIGGMGAAGNLALHDGSSATSTFTGLAQNFTMLNAEYYGVKRPVAQPESFVANASFWKMLANAGVTKVELNCRLTGASVGSTKASVQSISVLCEKDPVTATVFIDASYDGEIMVLATHSTYGRESIAEYNESLAGARVPTKFSTATGNPSPQVNALHPNGTILKYVQNISTLAAPGEADGALMAFQHRLCISGDASNKLPWKQPANYVADDFLLFLRYIEASDDNQTFNGFGFPGQDMHGSGYPGSKKKYTLCCGVTIAASDQPHLNAGWATASWEEKLAITAEYTYFELGMFYFLANDPRVPSPVKAKFNSYGICADEFQEWDGIPPQLYIRASNRMVGDFVLTQNSIINPAYKEDSIATGKWWFDEHMTGKYAVPSGNDFLVQLEGNFGHHGAAILPPYDVPFRMIIPARGTAANLLVPVALSASHVAFASTRIETMLMAIGTAAGVAATQLIDGSVKTVQDIDVAKVQSILVSGFGQQIHIPKLE